VNLFSQVRLDIKRDRVEIAEKENVPSVVLTPETATSQRNADYANR
jgi:hypothetical protein